MKSLIASLAACALTVPAAAATDMTPVQVADSACTARTVPIYFAPGEKALSPAASAALASVSDTFGYCKLAHVETAAYAGDAKSPMASRELATARQHAVLVALGSADLIGDAAIQRTARMDTLAGADRALPSARRVEVTFHLVPPALG